MTSPSSCPSARDAVERKQHDIMSSQLSISWVWAALENRGGDQMSVYGEFNLSVFQSVIDLSVGGGNPVSANVFSV